MILKFSLTTILALGSLSCSNVDAFLAPSAVHHRQQRRTFAPLQSDKEHLSRPDDHDSASEKFMGSKEPKAKPVDEELEASSGGGTRFKELLSKAQAGARSEPGLSRPIENPFLTPEALSPPQPADPANMSVEEQARMFREMMQGQAPAAVPRQPVYSNPAAPKQRENPRPQGRNRDADSIANSSDLYFAQLKRDSTVRTMARLRGEEDKADKVFEDEGIRQLEELLHTNPYLKQQKDQELVEMENPPAEVLRPFMETSKYSEEEMKSTGPSYKKKLQELKKSKGGGSSTSAAAVPEAVVEQQAPPQPVAPTPQAVSTPSPPAQQHVAPSIPDPTPQTIQQEQVAASTGKKTTETGSPEEQRQKIRTLMGMLLKHRGGPGFGSGRLKGPEIDRYDNLFKEVTEMLREEAMGSAPADVQMMPTSTNAAPSHDVAVPVAQPAVPSTPTAAQPANGAQVDSMIACIEGAITMYKNSPVEIRSSVLVTLGAALRSAVSTCDGIIGGTPIPVPPAASAQVDSMIACIEGAITMYKNSPPELHGSVLVTLRAALMSAVNTCDQLTGAPPQTQQVPAPVVPQQTVVQPEPVAVAPPSPAPATPPAQPEPVAVQPAAQADPAPATASPPPQTLQVHPGTDGNTKALSEIYDSLVAASGDGKLGLRSDLKAEEATDLADKIEQMRAILMQELDSGIPAPGTKATTVPAPKPTKKAEEPSDDDSSSTASKYQQMLAKARAEKATK